ncbi:MAG: hypothetical protein KAT70_00655, partial [Thermoplasmata archaeon]|nr:hypothetical protein [Thermoplasmata archaeon]
MKRAFFAIFVGALLLWFSVVPSTPANADEPEEGHLLINEVALATLDANARWFEVYNPTNDTISLHNWTYYFSGCYAVFNFPNIAIEPLLYATITPSIENFTNYWEVSDLDEVYQGMVPYESPTYMWIVDGDGEIVDDMGEPSTYVLNESWARYRDALDTNNFTNDFYIEPNPTP